MVVRNGVESKRMTSGDFDFILQPCAASLPPMGRNEAGDDERSVWHDDTAGVT